MLSHPIQSPRRPSPADRPAGAMATTETRISWLTERELRVKYRDRNDDAVRAFMENTEKKPHPDVPGVLYLVKETVTRQLLGKHNSATTTTTTTTSYQQ